MQLIEIIEKDVDRGTWAIYVATVNAIMP